MKKLNVINKWNSKALNEVQLIEVQNEATGRVSEYQVVSTVNGKTNTMTYEVYTPTMELVASCENKSLQQACLDWAERDFRDKIVEVEEIEREQLESNYFESIKFFSRFNRYGRKFALKSSEIRNFEVEEKHCANWDSRMVLKHFYSEYVKTFTIESYVHNGKILLDVTVNVDDNEDNELSVYTSKMYVNGKITVVDVINGLTQQPTF